MAKFVRTLFSVILLTTVNAGKGKKHPNNNILQTIGKCQSAKPEQK